MKASLKVLLVVLGVWGQGFLYGSCPGYAEQRLQPASATAITALSAETTSAEITPAAGWDYATLRDISRRYAVPFDIAAGHYDIPPGVLLSQVRTLQTAAASGVTFAAEDAETLLQLEKQLIAQIAQDATDDATDETSDDAIDDASDETSDSTTDETTDETSDETDEYPRFSIDGSAVFGIHLGGAGGNGVRLPTRSSVTEVSV